MRAIEDTIVALATPPGRGGLGVVRLSGPAASRIAAELSESGVELEPRRATLVTLVIARRDGGQVLRDEAILTAFPAPASYTGEDVVEASLHGSPLLAARFIEAAIARGARLARRGEFTLRAFLNGRLDLAQAEAVQDLVNATTAEQARMAFDQLQGTLSGRIAGIERELFELAARLEASIDFPDEGYHFAEPGEVGTTLQRVKAGIDGLLGESAEGRLLRDGALVAIVGRTNVGKSTIFNRLAGADRAIVADVPGTTRDLLTETVSICGVPVTLVDTAGVRESDDPVEREGVARAEGARRSADLVVVVLDRSEPLQQEDEDLLRETDATSRLVVVNKVDRESRWALEELPDGARKAAVCLSALQKSGIDHLAARIAGVLGVDVTRNTPPAIGNLRHVGLLRQAQSGLDDLLGRLTTDVLGQIPEEILLAELQHVREALEEVTGRRTTEDLLDEIFSKFCVGK